MKLHCLVMFAWVAWSVSVAMTLWIHFGRIMHPHFAWILLPLVVQLVAGATAVVWGLVRSVRGSGRPRAVGLALLALTPSLLWASHLAYGEWWGRDRAHTTPLNWPVKTAASAGASLLDAGIRFDYRRRLHGEHVVMVYDRVTNAAEQVTAMDRHVAELERLLGQRCKTKVHWVRGSAFGIGNRYFQGMAFGSACGDEPVPDELTTLDRHEVAHFVISHHRTQSSTPPSFLVEGWAEAHSGYEPGLLARRAWRHKQEGANIPSVRELTSEAWYSKTLDPVYVFGGPLVEYIGRTHGYDKLFQLYTTCRHETFAQDCQRVLGVTLDELDRAYWSDIDLQIAAMPADASSVPLAGLQLERGVDEAAWERFTGHLLDGFRRRQEALRQSRYTVEVRRQWTSDDGKEGTYRGSCEVIHDGDKHVLWDSAGGLLLLVTPEVSFAASRTAGTSSLEIITLQTGSAGLDYRTHRDLLMEWEDPSWMSLDTALWHTFRGEGIVTTLDIEEGADGRAMCSMRQPSQGEQADEEFRTWQTFDPTQGWAPVEWRSERVALSGGDEDVHSRRRGRIVYRRLEGGVVFPESVVQEYLDEQGNVTGIVERRFSEVELGPQPQESFSPERYGITHDQLHPGGIPGGIPAYLLWLFGGTVLSLVAGIWLVLPWTRITRASPASATNNG